MLPDLKSILHSQKQIAWLRAIFCSPWLRTASICYNLKKQLCLWLLSATWYQPLALLIHWWRSPSSRVRSWYELLVSTKEVWKGLLGGSFCHISAKKIFPKPHNSKEWVWKKELLPKLQRSNRTLSEPLKAMFLSLSGIRSDIALLAECRTLLQSLIWFANFCKLSKDG